MSGPEGSSIKGLCLCVMALFLYKRSHRMNDEEYMAEALKEAEIAMSEDGYLLDVLLSMKDKSLHVHIIKRKP